MVFLLFFKLSDVIHTACRSFPPWFTLGRLSTLPVISRRTRFCFGTKGVGVPTFPSRWQGSLASPWGLCVFQEKQWENPEVYVFRRFCSECSNIQVERYGLVVCILVSWTVLSIKQLQEITNLLGGSNVVKPVGDDRYQINLQCFKF